MKKRELLTELAERLELPQEALTGAAKLSVTGGRRLLIENHRGILAYDCDCAVISLGDEKLQILGSRLCLLAMNRRELLLGGKILSVEWV